jgi:hypothetical protein
VVCGGIVDHQIELTSWYAAGSRGIWQCGSEQCPDALLGHQPEEGAVAKRELRHTRDFQ